MTERLYYHDSRLLEFEGAITRTGREQERYYTVLDRTAFYPTSGGQANDTGRLNGVEIIDVQEADDGEIKHFSMEQVGESGAPVRGVIDRERRRRHCCFHTGQHVLSHVFLDLLNMPTVSVHLGEEYGAVEMNGVMPTDEQLSRAEDRANELIREAHPVTILFADAEEIETIPRSVISNGRPAAVPIAPTPPSLGW